MTLEAQVRYLLDRIEIQDKIALYGLGQDLHQPGDDDQDILEQWSALFTGDAAIDCTSVGLGVFALQDYAEMMRGPGFAGGGLEVPFHVWQHIEGHATVTIDGDMATSTAPHLHTHGVRGTPGNTFAVGYWHDRWERRAAGWRAGGSCIGACNNSTSIRSRSRPPPICSTSNSMARQTSAARRNPLRRARHERVRAPSR